VTAHVTARAGDDLSWRIFLGAYASVGTRPVILEPPAAAECPADYQEVQITCTGEDDGTAAGVVRAFVPLEYLPVFRQLLEASGVSLESGEH
jgi:hypothetical protein